MHIANVNVKKEWKKLQDLITEVKGSAFEFDGNKNYYLTNNGGDNIILLNTTTEPEEDSVDGVILCNKEQCGYKKDSGTVYVKSTSISSTLHIEEGN